MELIHQIITPPSKVEGSPKIPKYDLGYVQLYIFYMVQYLRTRAVQVPEMAFTTNLPEPAQPSHPNQPQSPDKQSSMTGSGWGSKKRGGIHLTEQRPNTGFTMLYSGGNLRHHHPIPISSAAPILNVDLHARLTLVQWLEGQWLGHHGIWSQLAILDTLPTPAKKGKVFQLDSHPKKECHNYPLVN